MHYRSMTEQFQITKRQAEKERESWRVGEFG